MNRYWIVLICMLLPATPASAQNDGSCLVGPSPGATLLFPYFEVDTSNPNGISTLISVNNGLSGPTLARVVLWTDTAVPTMAFDIYLGAFDIVTINIRDLMSGNVPSTGAGADLSELSGCDVAPPTYSTPIGTLDQRQQLVADHTGVTGPLFGTCIGTAYGDSIARGYITVDVANQCSGAEAAQSDINPMFDSDYFEDGGTGVAGNSNQLWGDLIFVDPDGNAVQGTEAIAIWADDERFSGADTYTFYGRYVGNDGRDNRIPLPSLWNQRFLNGGAFAGGASLVVWRDTGAVNGASGFACGGLPAGLPLTQTITAADEDNQNLVNLSNSTAVSLATQRADISDFSIPFSFGFLQLLSEPLQSWVLPTLTAGGRFSAGFNGAANRFLCGRTPPADALQASGGSAKTKLRRR